MRQTTRWQFECSMIGLYESVGGITDKEAAAYWKNPFVGIEIAESYNNIISEDFFRFRRDGITCSGRAQMFTGSRTWWRSDFSFGAGKKIGPLFLHGNTLLLLGNSLNIVNQFLAGGSWDILGAGVLYGYRYAEFRLSRALLVNGGTDVELFDSVELGIRAAYLNSPAKTTYGECVRISSMWHGINVNAGISFPEDALIRGAVDNAIAFAGITAAIFEP